MAIKYGDILWHAGSVKTKKFRITGCAGIDAMGYLVDMTS